MVDSSCKMVNNPAHSCKLTNRQGKSSILMVLTRKKDGDFPWAIFKEALYLGGQKACRIQDQTSPPTSKAHPEEGPRRAVAWWPRGGQRGSFGRVRLMEVLFFFLTLVNLVEKMDGWIDR